jgi:hypothetical protein
MIGAGTFASSDGLGVSAKFMNPLGLAVDSQSSSSSYWMYVYAQDSAVGLYVVFPPPQPQPKTRRIRGITCILESFPRLI